MVSLFRYFVWKTSVWCLLKPSYWLKKSSSIGKIEKNEVAMQDFFLDKESVNLKTSFCLNMLTKKFETSRAKKNAVDNLNLKIYENQITGLLGYNGAGKSTTIFMLTGLAYLVSISSFWKYNTQEHKARVGSFIHLNYVVIACLK